MCVSMYLAHTKHASRDADAKNINYKDIKPKSRIIHVIRPKVVRKLGNAEEPMRTCSNAICFLLSLSPSLSLSVLLLFYLVCKLVSVSDRIGKLFRLPC